MTHAFRPRALLPVLLLCCAVLAGCSREADDWRAAQSADTTAAYEQFTREHPASARTPEAEARIAQLAEDEDWRRAQEEDSLAAYQNFVSRHPDSHWAQEARVRIETITLASASAQDPAAGTRLGGDVQAGPTAPSPAGDLPAAATAGPHPATPPPAAKAPPAPRPAVAVEPARKSAPAPTVVAKSEASAAPVTYGVQLGAFASEPAARARWDALSGQSLAALKGRSPHVVAAQSPSGKVFRLQVASKDEAEARRLCTSLAASGQACVVVHP